VAWDGTNLCILGWTSANIYKLDRSGNLVGTIPLDSGGKGGIGWDGSCFWILNDNTICKYDAAGKLIGYINPLSERSYGYAWDGRYLWTAEKTNENWRDEKIYQVEVLKLRTKNPL
jgi:YD repeat-containing protein